MSRRERQFIASVSRTRGTCCTETKTASEASLKSAGLGLVSRPCGTLHRVLYANRPACTQTVIRTNYPPRAALSLLMTSRRIQRGHFIVVHRGYGELDLPLRQFKRDIVSRP